MIVVVVVVVVVLFVPFLDLRHVGIALAFACASAIKLILICKIFVRGRYRILAEQSAYFRSPRPWQCPDLIANPMVAWLCGDPPD